VHELSLAQSLVEAVLRETEARPPSPRPLEAGAEPTWPGTPLPVGAPPGAGGREGPVGRVTVVRVTVGGLTHVEPENLKFWYEELTKGTRLAGSALLVEKRPMLVWCQRCGRQFTVVANSFVCPACGVADVRLASGDELILESIEVEE